VPLELLARLFGEDDQRAVGHPVHSVENRDLAVVLLPGRREHDVQVALEQRLGRAVQDPREVRGVDEGDDDADEARAPGGEAPGAPVGRVAVLADDPRDVVPRLVRDVAASVEHARDGRDRDPGLVGDLADGRSLRGSLRHSAHSSMFRNVPEMIRLI
jgi:hypothetical protein